MIFIRFIFIAIVIYITIKILIKQWNDIEVAERKQKMEREKKLRKELQELSKDASSLKGKSSSELINEIDNKLNQERTQNEL